MTYLLLIVVAQKMTCVCKCVKHWMIVLFITRSWSPPQPLIPLTSHGRGCRSRSISLALQTTEEPCKLLQGLVRNIQWRICYCILSCIHNITYNYVCWCQWHPTPGVWWSALVSSLSLPVCSVREEGFFSLWKGCSPAVLRHYGEQRACHCVFLCK